MFQVQLILLPVLILPNVKGDLKRRFLLMQMYSIFERQRMSLIILRYFLSFSSHPLFLYDWLMTSFCLQTVKKVCKADYISKRILTRIFFSVDKPSLTSYQSMRQFLLHLLSST